ncbi:MULTISPECIES: MFS transporter [Betaproteobacteria]|jgi:MFS family permease|uniref:MFS transporter n=1 Tax=Thauera sinica TaxID=2665146 RepID=A0ABW1AMV1_9RHOO|nr:MULTISPECIES: MFS transporter [Betaproteobacteria]ATE61736.1 MFS transporter [Thauera sp. K11]
MTSSITATPVNAANTADAQRNVWLLVAAQSLGGAAPPIIISLGGIVGQMLASDPTLATLPVSLYQLGLALSTIPAAMLMRRLGRRAAYVLGALLGSVSGLIATYGVVQGDFATFCVGTAMAGFYGACVQSYRFAATDAVEPSQRAKAISRIMVGGLVAAVIGPQVVIWTRDAWPMAPFAGSFLGQAGLALLALPLLWMLRAPPPQAAVAEGTARPLGTIARSPAFVVAVTAGVVSYGLMAFIMTAAPMAMVGCGHTVGEAALGIQWHVLAMFAPSFFTGHLIARFGKIAITALGLVLIAASGLLALAGLELLHFWGSLILLGIGWNFGFIGATAMVTDTYTPAERAKVQALNDFLVFGTVAVASFGSGRLLNTSGWETINTLMLPLIAVVLVMLGWLTLRHRRTTTSVTVTR